MACATLPKLSLQEELTGTWTIDKIHVKMNTVHGTDKDSVAIVDQSDFIEQLGIYSNVEHYLANGSFENDFYVSQDSIILTTSGTWTIIGTDSLKIEQTKPVAQTRYYSVKIKKNRGIFIGLVDWDGDGHEDDEYTGTSTRSK